MCLRHISNLRNNTHIFTVRISDTLLSVRQSWDDPNSQDRQVVSYSKTVLAIIPTPVQLNTPEFATFWRKANENLALFGVKRQRAAPSIKVCVMRSVYSAGLFHETIGQF